MELSESIVLALLMYLLAIAISIVAAFVVHGIVVIVSRMETPASAPVEKRPVPAPAPPEEDAIPAGHVAAITAAVYAVLGAHRIVHIESGPPGTIWTTEGRLIHQTSHTPRGGR